MLKPTNDSYPTAIKVTILLRNDKLVAALEKLAASFQIKGDAYLQMVKMVSPVSREKKWW
jgi:aspartate ammonia-lyase